MKPTELTKDQIYDKMLAAIKTISGMKCGDYDHNWTGCCLDDAVEIADEVLRTIEVYERTI